MQMPILHRPSQTVNDPIEDEVNKNVFMGRLEDPFIQQQIGGRKHHYGHLTLVPCCYVEYATTLTAVHDCHAWGRSYRASPRQADVMIVAGSALSKWHRLFSVYMSKCLSQNGSSRWGFVPTQAVRMISIQWYKAWIKSFQMSMYRLSTASRSLDSLGWCYAQESITKERRPLGIWASMSRVFISHNDAWTWP